MTAPLFQEADTSRIDLRARYRSLEADLNSFIETTRLQVEACQRSRTCFEREHISRRRLDEAKNIVTAARWILNELEGEIDPELEVRHVNSLVELRKRLDEMLTKPDTAGKQDEDLERSKIIPIARVLREQERQSA
ncbi:MAG: hypothetical protein OEY44_03560 [Candidatus Peregrinibacteria bacterium]|nr:hypothetical protein [Candidatus Peregrinibacteria bacterium]